MSSIKIVMEFICNFQPSFSLTPVPYLINLRNLNVGRHLRVGEVRDRIQIETRAKVASKFQHCIKRYV